jgi:hypothetical protein
MRLTLMSMVALVALVATVAPGLACPPGYVSCGTRYCCPGSK